MADDFFHYELLDKYGYRRFGLVELWSRVDVARVLASFEMQTKGLCGLHDEEQQKSRLFNDYLAYVSSLINSGKLNYEEDSNLINKDELLEQMEANAVLKLDIARLRRFLSCDEEPDTSNPVKDIAAVTTRYINGTPCEEIGTICTQEVPKIGDSYVSKTEYRFVKIGHSWNIQFGDIELSGLKHMIGFDYIKLLLQNKYNDIGVLDIQAMLNPDICNSSHQNKFIDDIYEPDEHDEQGYNETAMNIMSRLSDEDKARSAMLYKEIKEIKAKLESAKKNNETISASRLAAQLNMVEDDLYNILNSRTDDPELEKNRKKVYKNIQDARISIRDLEISSGYHDTPVYNYLKKYIETGYTCKYNPLVDDPIQWIF